MNSRSLNSRYIFLLTFLLLGVLATSSNAFATINLGSKNCGKLSTVPAQADVISRALAFASHKSTLNFVSGKDNDCQWTEDRMNQVNELVAELDVRLPEFMSRTRKNGFGRITLSEVDSSTIEHDGGIILSCKSFSEASEMGSIKTTILVRTLFHEMAHVFDQRKEPDSRHMFNPPFEVSTLNSFMELTGWRELSVGYFEHALKTNEFETEAFRVERTARADGKKKGEGLSSIAKQNGLPTYYSLTSPSEHFAELATFIFLDETAASYLKPEVVSWFKKNILR